MARTGVLQQATKHKRQTGRSQPSPAQSPKKEQWVVDPSTSPNGVPSRDGSQEHATQISFRLRKLTYPMMSWFQRILGCARKVGDRASCLRSSGRRSTASGWPTSRPRAARAVWESKVRHCQRRLEVLATRASSCARGVCSFSITVAVPREALLLYMHTEADLSKEN